MSQLDELMEQRRALDRQIEEMSRKERSEAIATCLELIKRFDLQPTDLGFKRNPKKNVAAPKYVGPDGQTWAGRGRKPLWLQEAEKEGKTMDDFLIVPAGARSGEQKPQSSEGDELLLTGAKDETQQ